MRAHQHAWFVPFRRRDSRRWWPRTRRWQGFLHYITWKRYEASVCWKKEREERCFPLPRFEWSLASKVLESPLRAKRLCVFLSVSWTISFTLRGPSSLILSLFLSFFLSFTHLLWSLLKWLVRSPFLELFDETYLRPNQVNKTFAFGY